MPKIDLVMQYVAEEAEGVVDQELRAREEAEREDEERRWRVRSPPRRRYKRPGMVEWAERWERPREGGERRSRSPEGVGGEGVEDRGTGREELEFLLEGMAEQRFGSGDGDEGKVEKLGEEVEKKLVLE